MPQTDKYDIAVVGGGIVGLAMAWAGARKGYSVVLFERDRQAVGASIRNFGMVWPIGQPSGDLFSMAMRSRELWLELHANADVWVHQCGSLHLLRHDDEVAVVEEFLESDPRASSLKLLTPSEVGKKSKAANLDGLKAAMWSPIELCVNPVRAMSQIAQWLAESQNVDFRSATAITGIDDQTLCSAAGETFHAERIFVCAGHDFATLFPKQFNSAGLTRCKLQMMATDCQPNDWKIGPHIAGGLTLRHYKAFDNCKSIAALKSRVANENPLLDQFGIHVMASQNDQGQVILGDSHQYDEAITPFDSDQIDQLILTELRKLICLPDFEIRRRWHGIYSKHPTKHVCQISVNDHCQIVTATGGAGMTLALGLAEKIINQET